MSVPTTYANSQIVFYGNSGEAYPPDGAPRLEIDNKPRLFTSKLTLEDYVPEHEMLVNTTRLSSDTIDLGQSVSVVETADCGYSDQKFSLRITQGETEMESHTLDNPQDFNYIPPSAGEYVFESYVEDEKGLCSKSYLVLQVIDDPALHNHSTVSCTECRSGDDIIINLSATGGTGQYTFDVRYRYDNGSLYPIILDTTDASVTFKTPKNGNLELNITVNDGDDTVTITKNVTVYKTLINTSERVTQSCYVDSPVEFSLGATGGKGSYTYDVFCTYKNGETVQVASDTSDESVQFTPDQSGNASVLITAKDGVQTKDKTLYFTIHDKVELTFDISEGPYLTGDGITFTCSASGGVGSYLYYLYYRIDDGEWIDSDTMSGDTWSDTFYFMQPGKYDFKVTVSDSNRTDEITHTVNVGVQLTNESYIAGGINQWYVGIDQLEIVFGALGGSGGYTYSASVSFTGETEYTETLCEKVTQNEIFFDPTEAGFYTFTVTVFDSDGNSAETSFDVEIHNTVTNTSHIDGDLQQCTVGDRLELVISAEGGYEPYSYDVYYKYDDGDYYRYDSGDGFRTIGFDTDIPGTLTFKVVVRDEYAIFSGEAEKEISIIVNEALVNKSYIEGNQTYFYTDEPIRLIFDCEGGAQNGFSCSVYYRYDNNEYSPFVLNLQNPTDQVFYPQSDGTLSFKVVITDSSGQTAEKSLSVTVYNKLENKCAIPGYDKNTFVGEDIVIDCSASGGKAPYLYAVSYKTEKNDPYSTYADYSDYNSIIVNSQQTGNLWLKISVKDELGTVKSIYKYFSVKTQKLTCKCNVEKTVMPFGQPFTVICDAEGGITDVNDRNYQYALAYKDYSEDSGEYHQVCDFGDYTKMEFNPEKAGKYLLKMSVKAPNGAEKNLYKTVMTGLTNTCTLDTQKIVLGETITVNCSAVGGYPGYTFALAYRTASQTDYTQVSDFAECGTMSFTPETYGSYKLKISVKDSHNTIKNIYKNVWVSPQPLVNLSEPESTHLTVTPAQVAVHFAATGGYGGYQYSVALKVNGEYVEKRAFSESEAARFEITEPGTYKIRMTVRDAKGTVKNIYKDITVKMGEDNPVVN